MQVSVGEVSNRNLFGLKVNLWRSLLSLYLCFAACRSISVFNVGSFFPSAKRFAALNVLRKMRKLSFFFKEESAIDIE